MDNDLWPQHCMPDYQAPFFKPKQYKRLRLSGRPKRDSNICEEDIINLRIRLNEKISFEHFLEMT
jgi:hypothetical protein